MNILQQTRIVPIAFPQARVNNAAVTTATVDTLGFNKCRIKVLVGDIDATMAVFKVAESDDSGMSGETDITSTIFGGTGNPALPTASDDNKVYLIHLDLKGRKRYLDLKLTTGNGAAGTFVTAEAELYDALTVPNTAAEQGAAVCIYV